ncbi:hypothetical protein Tco_0363093 [Tanacetum coccineum]
MSPSGSVISWIKLPVKLDHPAKARKESASFEKDKVTVPNGVKVREEVETIGSIVRSWDCHRDHIRENQELLRGYFISPSYTSINARLVFKKPPPEKLEILFRVSNGVTRKSSRSRGGIGRDKLGKHVCKVLDMSGALISRRITEPEVDRLDLDEPGNWKAGD